MFENHRVRRLKEGVSAIEQSLGMNLSQHLAMTMQLQQAIQILQLSSQDLCAVIEKNTSRIPCSRWSIQPGGGSSTSRTAA